jgi:hypothetical protein
MVLDPASGKPARVGYEIKPDGTKERIFKVSPHHETRAKKAEKAPKAKTDKGDNKDDAKQAQVKAGKK